MRGSAPRKVWVAASGSPSSTRSAPPPERPPAATAARPGELLGVVDDDEPQPGPQPVERVGVGLEVVGRGAEDPGGVEGAGGRQGRDLVVLAQHVGGRDPLGAVVGVAEPGEVLGVEAQLDGPHQQVAQLAPEGAGGQGEVHRRRPRGRGRLPCRVPGQQLTEDDVLLGAAEQPRRWVAGQRRRLAQDAEAERLVGASQRRRGGAAEPGGDGVAQPGGREPGGREQEAAVGGGLAVLDALGHHLDGHRGQAGARGAQHPQHRAAVLTTARWLASSTGTCGATGAGRRRTSTQRSHHAAPTSARTAVPDPEPSLV